MSETDRGGDAPCWAHLFDDGSDTADESVDTEGHGLVVDLGSDVLGSGGAVWSLPHGGDLDANLVRLAPNAAIGEHVNSEVDVLVYVQSGTGVISVNGSDRQVAPDHLALIPRMAGRSVTAGPDGITYLSVHRRRGPLRIRSSTQR